MLIITAIIAAFTAFVLVSTFYKAPSCTDGVQNQNEAGVDCGGPCRYLCTAQVQPPTVLFSKAIQNSQGRTDVVASIENKNATAAAKDVPYRITLYGAGQSLIQQVTGTLDLPPFSTVSVYLPGIAAGKQKVVNTFLDIEATAPQWFTMANDPRIVPTVSNTTLLGTPSAPRIDAVLTNPSIRVLANVRVVVLVRSASGDVMAASETIVPTIPAQGRAIATFTWNNAFASTPTSVEAVPIIPLPARGLP